MIRNRWLCLRTDCFSDEDWADTSVSVREEVPSAGGCYLDVSQALELRQYSPYLVVEPGNYNP